MTTVLIYIGKGDALYNVPARDLTEEDFAERAEAWKEFGITEAAMLASGLYEKPKTEQPKTYTPARNAGENKAAKDGA